MLHTTEKFLKVALDELIDGDHKCCLEAATADWSTVLLTKKYNAFFAKLVIRVCDEEGIPEEVSGEASFVFLQLLIAGLSIGTLCGTSMMSQAHEEIENAAAAAIEKLMGRAIKNEGATFIKRGPKENV